MKTRLVLFLLLMALGLTLSSLTNAQNAPDFTHVNIIETQDYKMFEFCTDNENGKMVIGTQKNYLPTMTVDQEELSCKGALFLGRDWMYPTGNEYKLQDYREFYYTAVVNDTIVALLVSEEWEYDIPDAQIVWNIDVWAQINDSTRVYGIKLYNEFFKEDE